MAKCSKSSNSLRLGGLYLTDRQKRAVMIVSWFVTFHYVVIGWVWFALPEVGESARVLARLVGITLVL